MTKEQRNKYRKIMMRYANETTTYATILHYMRYEALRQLNPREYAELCKRNRAGDNFDELVDLLILDELKL